MQQRSSGFGGMMSKISSNKSHIPRNDFDDETALPSKFKSE